MEMGHRHRIASVQCVPTQDFEHDVRARRPSRSLRPRTEALKPSSTDPELKLQALSRFSDSGSHRKCVASISKGGWGNGARFFCQGLARFLRGFRGSGFVGLVTHKLLSSPFFAVMYVCIYIYIYIYMCVYIYIYIYIYIYLFI